MYVRLLSTNLGGPKFQDFNPRGSTVEWFSSSIRLGPGPWRRLDDGSMCDRPRRSNDLLSQNRLSHGFGHHPWTPPVPAPPKKMTSNTITNKRQKKQSYVASKQYIVLWVHPPLSILSGWFVLKLQKSLHFSIRHQEHLLQHFEAMAM